MDGSDSVRCRSELSRCCSEAQGDLRGDWFFPSGERLPYTTHLSFLVLQVSYWISSKFKHTSQFDHWPAATVYLH